MRSGSSAWPPYREPAKCHEAYSDPRKILKSRVFHALVWLVLYKAVTQHTVSEHVVSLVIYLLEMAVAVTDPTDQPTQVSRLIKCLISSVFFLNKIMGRIFDK